MQNCMLGALPDMHLLKNPLASQQRVSDEGLTGWVEN